MIARLQGYCLGVGLELALACDFRVAADDAQLGLPEVGLGMIPGSGGTQRLARLVGLGRAKDVVMRRRRIDAAEALAWGLVSEIVPPGELDEAVDRVLADLHELSPLALRTAKRVLNHVYDAPLSIGLELEGLAYGMLRSTDDFRRGCRGVRREAPAEVRGPLSPVDFGLVRSSYQRHPDQGGEMQYMCLIYDDENTWQNMPEDERNAAHAEYGTFTQAIKDSGNHVAGDALQPISTATSVRVRNGETLVTDGPFAETKEQLGGYYLIEAKDVDEALKIAERIPSARYGTIEVRPVVVWEE